MDRPPLHSLTSLRFITALHVFLFHLEASRILYAPDWLRPLAAVGYVGVNWFFVLSGFILAYAYAGRPMALGDFWRARWARVYPAYLVSLCLAAPLFAYVVFHASPASDPGWAVPMREHIVSFAVLTILLLQAWVPAAALSINLVGWSLSVEAFFYLAFPLMLSRLAALPGRGLVALLPVLGAASVSMGLAYVLLAPDGVSEATYDMNHLPWLNVLRYNPLVRLPEFLIGVCGGLLYLRGAVPGRWATAMVGGGLVALLAIVLAGDRVPYPVVHNGLLSLPFLAIIWGVALRPRWSAILEWRPFRLLGEWSYGFFLTHILVIALVLRPDGTYREHSLFTILVCLALAQALAFGLYRWVETPARRGMARVIASRRAILNSHGH